MRRTIPADVQAFLDKFEPQIRDAFIQAIARIKSSAQLRLVIGHLENRDIPSAIAALHLNEAFLAPLDRHLDAAHWEGGVATLAGLPRLTDPFPGNVSSSCSTGGTSEPRRGSGSERET